MLLELFIFFFVLAVTVIFLGYYSEVDILKITGFMFLFVLGTVLFGFNGGGVSYHDGDNLTVSGSQTIVTPLYTDYNNHTFGFFTSVIGIIGFASVYLQRKGGVIEQ